MEFNKIVFPAPQSSYDEKNPNLHYINKKNGNRIPFLFYRNAEIIEKLIIFYHGNSEDCDLAYTFITSLCDVIGAHGLLVEYPGYGVYQN